MPFEIEDSGGLKDDGPDDGPYLTGRPTNTF